MIRTITIPVTTTGGAGVAAGTGTSDNVVSGEVLGVYLNFHASAPATTDTTISTVGGGPPSYNLLAVSNSATDAYFAPRAGAVSAANAAITDSHTPFVVADRLKVVLAQCDALTNAVVAHVIVQDQR